MRTKKRLSAKLQTLLLMGCKQAGSFKPEEALIGVEESMTQSECRDATEFLKWVTENKRTFGHNIDTVWAEWQSTLVAV